MVGWYNLSLEVTVTSAHQVGSWPAFFMAEQSMANQEDPLSGCKGFRIFPGAIFGTDSLEPFLYGSQKRRMENLWKSLNFA